METAEGSIPETPQDPPEEALIEAEKEEERIASQSDMAKLYDAVKELTKAITDLKTYTEKKWDETETWRKAGKF